MTSRRHIGIEIECESNSLTEYTVADLVNSPLASGRWMMAQEGSLRAGTNGWEIKTSGDSGLPAEDVRHAMNEVSPLLSDSSGIWRAAVHVHVDVRDFIPRDMAALMSVLYCLDGEIFDRFSPHRKESNFCVPLYNITPHVMSTLRALYSGRDMRTLRWNKYSSCNFGAVGNFGSVEFRHMQTPAGMGGVTGGGSAVECIWDFAETAVDLVDAVFAYRKRPVAEIIQMVAEDQAYRLPAERAYTALAAAKGGGVSSMTDDDLGSIFVAAGGNHSQNVEPPHDPELPEPEEGDWPTSDSIVDDMVLSREQIARAQRRMRTTLRSTPSTIIFNDAFEGYVGRVEETTEEPPRRRATRRRVTQPTGEE